MAQLAAIPTYNTAASVLERKNGAGLRLIGWTVLRTAMIAPPMMFVGVPTRKAFTGALIASAVISGFTLLRLYNAGPIGGLAGRRRRRRR